MADNHSSTYIYIYIKISLQYLQASPNCCLTYGSDAPERRNFPNFVLGSHCHGSSHKPSLPAKAAEPRKGHRSPLESPGSFSLRARGRGTILKLERHNGLPVASIQNSPVYLIKYILNGFALTLGLFELSAGFGGGAEGDTLGERGREDCVFL